MCTPSDLSSAIPTTRVSEPHVRVTEWRFPPGSATGHHRHDFDYVVVPLTAGELTIVDATGTATRPISPQVPYSRAAGVEHDVQNRTAAEVIFVEIEFMDRPG
ncbi:cupin [Zavarzinia sp. CC-PAN008]|uniref:cupin n=1 Tax=Zavarzinia sp. CC-PAN008 TaxID=3243332 RepID=UPI003F74A680